MTQKVSTIFRIIHITNSLNFMIGIYEIDKSRIDEVKRYKVKKLLLLMFCVYLLFLSIVLIGNEPDKLQLIGIISVSIWIPSLIALAISVNLKIPTNNTRIELLEDQIIRSGDNLLTVRMKYDEIGKIMEKPNGTIILKKGLMPKVNLHTNRFALISEFGILFIP